MIDWYGGQVRQPSERSGTSLENLEAWRRVADYRAEERETARGQPGGARRDASGGDRRANRRGERAALSVPARFSADGAADDGADAGAGEGLGGKRVSLSQADSLFWTGRNRARQSRRSSNGI